MNMLKKFVSGLGAQNAPFGFAPEDPNASYKAGLSYIGDIGANLMANNQGGVDPFANLGTSIQQAKQSGTQRNKEAYTAQRLMEEAAAKKAEREQAAQRQAMIDEQIAQLPPELQGLAKIAPEKVFGAQIDQMFGSPDMTDDMKEYNWAVQNGYGGSPIDFLNMKKAGATTNITVEGNKYGTIPPGFQLMQDDNGVRMEPIPGSPAAVEAAQAQAAAGKKTATQNSTADMMVEDIDRTLATVNNSTLPTTGTGGAILKGTPGTGAFDVNKLLVGIRANIGFDRLQRMREESPTGGALGQVAVQELESLQSIYGSLEQAQSKSQFEFNLKRLKNKYLDIVHGEGSGPAREKLDTGRGATNAPNPAAQPPAGIAPDIWEAMDEEDRKLWQ
jgi:hypothetical protein